MPSGESAAGASPVSTVIFVDRLIPLWRKLAADYKVKGENASNAAECRHYAAMYAVLEHCARDLEEDLAKQRELEDITMRTFRTCIDHPEVPKEQLKIYESNSWRRVGTQIRYREVMTPYVHQDGQPDISGTPVLRALVAAFNAMLTRARDVIAPQPVVFNADGDCVGSTEELVGNGEWVRAELVFDLNGAATVVHVPAVAPSKEK